MRISLIGPLPPYRGGISDFNYTLFKEIDTDHDIQLINYSTLYPNFLFPGKTQFKETVTDNQTSERLLSSINPFSWESTANSIIDFNPELVIIHYWMPFFAPALGRIASILKKSGNTKIVAICHNLTPHEKQKIGIKLTKSFVEKIDSFIIMSESVKNDLLYVNQNAQYVLTPHPIYDIFGQPVDKNVARNKLRITAKNVILYFGLIREYKGLDILLKSVPLIRNNLNDFIIVVAGECYENPQKYHKIIKDLTISEFVDLRLKFISENDVKNYFSAADVVALPYKNATQSGIAQIAYNFNRPVIVSDVGGLSEIVLDGKTGFVVEPDPKDFGMSITKYFKENRFNEFSKNIKSHKKLFSWKNFVDKLMEIYSQ